MNAADKYIDRFEVKRILGEGGQGIVFLAHDPKLGRDVAIKTLVAASEEEIGRLLEEARSVSTLRHPCIVPVFEAGDFQGTPYLVFEYVTGETLDALIRRSGALPVEQALRIAGQMLDGLAHAHRQGVLHRDFKPANIMLDADGTPRIMDFGAASRTQIDWQDSSHVGVDQQLIGTPSYMAPEYIEAGLYSSKTDIFSAGLLVCEMLTGQRVFTGQGQSLDQLLRAVVEQPVTLPGGHGLHPEVLACLHKAMAKDPAQRYESVLEMRQALLQAGQPDSAQTPVPEGKGTLEFLLRRIKLKKEFPAMSESISKVNGIAFSDAGSITSMTNAVLKDFALTNKIIKLANSNFYNATGSGGIATVSAAVYRLGFDTIRNIVLGLLLFDNMKDRDQAQDLKAECMQAILGGVIAKEICQSQGWRNAEESFVCAMMHKLGRLLSVYYFPEETGEIRKLLALGESDEDRASRSVLGASWTELGQGVAKSWGFPQLIIGCMDKPGAGATTRAAPGSAESTRLVVNMASELSAAAMSGDAEEQKRRIAATLDKYSPKLKLDANAKTKVLGRSLEKFKEYSAAIGWKLDRTITRRLDQLTQPSEHQPADEPGLMPTAAAPRAEMAPGAAQPVHKRSDANREALAGGIQDITTAMVDGRKLNELLRIVVETIYTGLGFDHAILALRDPRRGVMLGRFGLGEGIDALVAQFQFPMAFAPDVFHVALQKNIDIFIADSLEAKIAARIPQWHRQAFAARSFLVLPIIVNDKPLGMIYADAAGANSIAVGEDEIKLLRTLRNQTVLAVRQSA